MRRSLEEETRKNKALEEKNEKLRKEKETLRITVHQQEKRIEKLTNHSMATANLKKSEDFVTNTTAASKKIPRRPKISMN